MFARYKTVTYSCFCFCESLHHAELALRHVWIKLTKHSHKSFNPKVKMLNQVHVTDRTESIEIHTASIVVHAKQAISAWHYVVTRHIYNPLV